MRRAADRTRTGSFTLAPGVHRPRCPEPCLDRTRLSTHPKQARYSTDYAQICGTNIMRDTDTCHLEKSSPFRPRTARIHDSSPVTSATERAASITCWLDTPPPPSIGSSVLILKRFTPLTLRR